MLTLRFYALEHPTPELINCDDRKIFACTVLWLEDQKIRHYKVEDREKLRKIDNTKEWEKAYKKYKTDLKMPHFNQPCEEMIWLTSCAIRYEYLDAVDKYQNITSKEILEEKSKSIEPTYKAANMYDNMNFNDPEFIKGVDCLSNKLEIANHPNHLLRLDAAAKIIEERIGISSINRNIIEGKEFPFGKGNDVVTNDTNLDYPVRMLRLLQIQKLRDLQTKINETLVAVQELTADPKTDTKIGKVGSS